MHTVIFAVTSPCDYAMSRIIVLGSDGFFIVLQGSHCSCYGFDDTSWDGMEYTREELDVLMARWREHDSGPELDIAALWAKY